MNGKKDVFRSAPGGAPRRTRARGGSEASGGGAAKSSAKLSRTDQHRIGDLLQRVYDDVVSEGVPDRFKALLDQLEPPKLPEQSGAAVHSTADKREALPPANNLDKETSG